MFPHGATTYIDDIGKLIPLHDGSIHTALHTGCGVRLFDRNRTQKIVLRLSVAPSNFEVNFRIANGDLGNGVYFHCGCRNFPISGQRVRESKRVQPGWTILL
jgi:hypothetical protein